MSSVVVAPVVSPDVAVLAPVAPSAEPLPLPAPAWGAVEALRAVAEARLALPVDLHGARVVSALTTVVLRAGAYAVKVYPPGTSTDHLDRLVRALADSASAHVPLWPAVWTSYGVVTVMPWISGTRRVSWVELGRLLRRFHDEHATADVPSWMPLCRLPSQVTGLDPDVAAILLAARDALLAAVAGVGSELGEGTIHGDVSPNNVLATPVGPRLIDLDWVVGAPREYDLASASRRFRAGEVSRRTYLGFCRAYGADVLSWPGLPVLDRIADLDGVAFRLWDCRHHGCELDWVWDEAKLWRTPL